MNITFPHLDVNPFTFIASLFIGIAPWNFFSCSAGAILRELTTTNDIMSGEKYLLVRFLCNLVDLVSFMLLANTIC